MNVVTRWLNRSQRKAKVGRELYSHMNNREKLGGIALELTLVAWGTTALFFLIAGCVHPSLLWLHRVLIGALGIPTVLGSVYLLRRWQWECLCSSDWAKTEEVTFRSLQENEFRMKRR